MTEIRSFRRKNSMKAIASLLLLIIFNSNFLFSQANDTTSLQEIAQKAREIEQALGVAIVYTEIVEGTWNGSKYQIPTHKGMLKRYLRLLDMEYRKYPYGYFKKALVETIVLAEKFSFKGEERAAMPDPYRKKLYFAIDGAYGDHSDVYLIHVLHHELHHSTEYAIWQDMYYRWEEWAKLNPPKFTYGKGGVTAYSDRSTNYYEMKHPVAGFVNLYSTLGQEEDRSEIVALMMSDLERPLLKKFCKTDSILKNKVKKMVGLLNKFADASGNTYWEKKMKEEIF